MIIPQWTRVKLIGENMDYAGHMGTVIRNEAQGPIIYTLVAIDNTNITTECNPINLEKIDDGFHVQFNPRIDDKSARIIVTPKDNYRLQLSEKTVFTTWYELAQQMEEMKAKITKQNKEIRL